MKELLEENLRKVLSYLASETMKARKNGKIGRAERLSVAFKILSEEYDDIKHHKEAEN
jgi:SHS2 domain-containing protein